MALQTRFEGYFMRIDLKNGDERKRGVSKGVPNTPNKPSERRQDLNGLDIFLDFALDGLRQLNISQEGAFWFGLELSILKLFQTLLGYLGALSTGKELQMLEIIIIPLEWSERDIESNWYIRLQDCTLGKHLENSHILSIKILSFLRDPVQIQLALHLISDLDFLLPTHRQSLAVAKVNSLMVDADQLVLLAFKEQLFLKNIGMLSNLHVC